MAKSSKAKGSVENSQTKQETVPSADPLAHEGVDRIRDILFGAHIQEYETRFQEFKSELEARYQELKEILDKRSAELKSDLNAKEAALSKRLEQEIDQRENSDDDLSKQLSNTREKLEDDLNQAKAELTEKLDQINHAKTDRQLLATLLRQVAEGLEKA